MFNPSRDEVRQFFCGAWRKHRQAEILTPLEAMAVDWMQLHPEYHDTLEAGDEALIRDYTPESGWSTDTCSLIDRCIDRCRNGLLWPLSGV